MLNSDEIDLFWLLMTGCTYVHTPPSGGGCLSRQAKQKKPVKCFGGLASLSSISVTREKSSAPSQRTKSMPPAQSSPKLISKSLLPLFLALPPLFQALNSRNRCLSISSKFTDMTPQVKLSHSCIVLSRYLKTTRMKK